MYSHKQGEAALKKNEVQYRCFRPICFCTMKAQLGRGQLRLIKFFFFNETCTRAVSIPLPSTLGPAYYHWTTAAMGLNKTTLSKIQGSEHSTSSFVFLWERRGNEAFTFLFTKVERQGAGRDGREGREGVASDRGSSRMSQTAHLEQHMYTFSVLLF